jgi:RimJ/RimL family protein N-acetyltransferase
MYYQLWTNPIVMRNVGFPHGLPITLDEVCAKIAEHIQIQGDFGRLLVVEEKTSGTVIGECKMYLPDENGISETDVKLLPKYWGQKYGVEIKRGLVNHLFTNTDCKIVQATPNINNTASIKMQEAVGGVRVGQDTFYPSEEMKTYACPVPYYIYHVHRHTWENERGKNNY